MQELSLSVSDDAEPLLQRLYDRQGSPLEFKLSDYYNLCSGNDTEFTPYRDFLFPEFKNNRETGQDDFQLVQRYSDIKVLVDENLAKRVYLPIFWDLLGPASAVKKGIKDPDVFRRAIDHHFDIIVTRDMCMDHAGIDLTAIALKHFRHVKSHHERRVRNKFPLIVHMAVPDKFTPKAIRHLIQEHYIEIRQAVIDRRTPVILLSPKNGVVDARSFLPSTDWLPEKTSQGAAVYGRHKNIQDIALA